MVAYPACPCGESSKVALLQFTTLEMLFRCMTCGYRYINQTMLIVRLAGLTEADREAWRRPGSCLNPDLLDYCPRVFDSLPLSQIAKSLPAWKTRPYSGAMETMEGTS